MTMIENSDRGITLAKPLAWTILVSLVAGGLWVGSQIGTLAEVQKDVAAHTLEIASLRADQRAAEIEAARDNVKLSQILATVTRLEGRFERIERDVREGRARPGAPEQ